jgi:hypothetical protein
MVKKRLHKVIKATKIILILAIILCAQQVGMKSENGKISNINVNKTLDLSAMAYKLNEINMQDIYYPLDTLTGDLTGYAADCPLCGGTLGCTGQNVLDGTTTYDDKTYGTVEIVASSKSLACGSIITWEMNGEKRTAIVLDRGVLGTDIDLLSPSEEYASKYIGRRKITYDVLRVGWTR